MRNIEAIFGGVLVLFVAAAAIFAVLTFPGGEKAKTAKKPAGPLGEIAAIRAGGDDVICECFDAGFSVAGGGGDVMSSQYHTGLAQCKAFGKADGANAWTAGWNARLSAKPYEASCRAYRRKRNI